MSTTPASELFRMKELADPRDAMIMELWKRLDKYQDDEQAKIKRDVQQAHAKIRFLRTVFLAMGTAFAGAVGTALVKVLVGK
jgi:hypothetical protein